MAGLTSVPQADWGRGIFRGRNAPSGSVYDAVNALVNDEDELFKRGGSTYKSNANVALALVGLASPVLAGGTGYTVFWTSSNFYKLAVDDATPTLVTPTGSGIQPAPFVRGAVINDLFLARGANPSVISSYDGGANIDGISAPAGSVEYVAAVGSPPRLISTRLNRAYFSDPATTTFSLSNYHELPHGALIIGADSLRSTLVLFTTVGVWTVSNMDLDPIDDAGNVQQQVSQVNQDVILWDDAGIVGWAGGLIVPAVDDVYVMTVDGATNAVSGAIRPLYREYVKLGYRCGLAAVHRGHYFLPILNGTTVVDVLVCRLDTDRPAWTRWAGHAAGGAYAVRVGATTREPKLLGASGQRVIEMTACFNVPGTATDADGTTPAFTIDTQDYAVGSGVVDSYVDRVRVEYEAAGTSPVVSVGWSSGTEGASFTTLTAARGGAASDGSDYSAWPVRKSKDRIRFRVSSTSAVTKLILRRLEVLVRPNGRQ